MKYPIGTLVAVMRLNLIDVWRIARVIGYHGDLVVVETDDEIEGDAAVEYDFPTPEPVIFEIHPTRLRPIVEQKDTRDRH